MVQLASYVRRVLFFSRINGPNCLLCRRLHQPLLDEITIGYAHCEIVWAPCSTIYLSTYLLIFLSFVYRQKQTPLNKSIAEEERLLFLSCASGVC